MRIGAIGGQVMVSSKAKDPKGCDGNVPLVGEPSIPKAILWQQRKFVAQDIDCLMS